MIMFYFLKLLQLFYFIELIKSDSWYLSNNGYDNITCGTKKHPCLNFYHVVQIASRNDFIHFMAEEDQEKFHICQNGRSIDIDKSLTIRGIEFVPLLKCSMEKNFGIMINDSSDGGDIEVKFEDVAFQSYNFKTEQKNVTCKPDMSGFIKVINANLSLQNCVFNQICTAINIEFHNTSLFSVHINFTEFDMVSYVLYSEKVDQGNIQIHNTKIIGNANIPSYTSHAISLSLSGHVIIQITNTAIKQTHEGLSLTVYSGYPNILLDSMIFSENSGQSVIVTFGRNTNRNKSSLLVKDSHFIQNSGVFASALNIVDKLKSKKIIIKVNKCYFHDNQADTFFGSVYADGVSMYIESTTFTNNVAGAFHSTIQGFGGAIYVEASTNVYVEHSIFINNTCSGFGGTIFSRGSFTCINCEFIGPSGDVVRPLLGDILYATAGLHLANTTWQSTVMKEVPRSLIWHPGSPTVEQWGITVKGFFKASCPEGHNISHSGIVRNDDISSRMEMSCRPCPRNEYSLTSGALTVMVNKGIAYESEKIIAKCHRCKYGGICLKGSIKAQANYYGYRSGPENDQVSFISCPIGYCCQNSETCQKYNSCQKNRYGLLCGKCKQNMSENLINSNCVPPKECNDFWFWFLFLPSGFLYILSFMYLDYISYFLKKQLIWWNIKVLHRQDLEDYDIIDGPENTLSADEIHDVKTNVSKDDTSSSGGKQDISYEKQDPSLNDEQCTSSKFQYDFDETDIFSKPGQNSQNRGPDFFTDFITISFYFFQMFLLIRMRESIVLEQLWSCLRSVYSSIFTLSVHANSSMFLCPIHGLTAVTKLLFIKSFSCYVLILLFIFHSLVYILQYMLLSRREETLIVFSVRLKVATIRILLIAYATIGETGVTLVTCTPMTSQSVLLIDGTITCYTWWQYLIFVFVFTWVVPFPVVIVISLIHLKYDVISYHQFVIAWLFPLPYLIWSLVLFKLLKVETQRVLKGRLREHENFDPEEELSIKEILFRLECSYHGDAYHLKPKDRTNSQQSVVDNLKHVGYDHKAHLYRINEPLFWQGALIGRRLILILTLTFVTQPVLKYYCALLLLTLYLIHQLYYRPYVISLVNMYETVTSAVLVIFCSMNLFFAYSYVSDLPPDAADEKLSLIFRWFEAIILVVLPTLVVCVVSLLVLTRISILLFEFCKLSSENFRMRIRP